MVQFTPKIEYPRFVIPKMALSQEDLREEIREEARMIQRAYDYFQANKKARNVGIPNSRAINPFHLKWARTLEPVYKLEECPDDEGEFPECWIKHPHTFHTVLEQFSWYATQLISKKPDERLVSPLEFADGREAAERWIDLWRRRIPRVTIIKGPDPNFKPTPEPKPVVCKPFVSYQKFSPVVPYEPTKEELAELERVRKESEACGTPSEQTARCYLFDRIDTCPSARATLEKQAREDPKAAFHLELLKKKKQAAADEAKKSEPLSNSEEERQASDEISVKFDEQRERVRQMYAAGTDEGDDKVFQIESGPLDVPVSRRRCRKPTSTGCPTGILIEF